MISKHETCPYCDYVVRLPEVAVRLSGRLHCDNCNRTFAYNWHIHYNQDGALKEELNG